MDPAVTSKLVNHLSSQLRSLESERFRLECLEDVEPWDMYTLPEIHAIIDREAGPDTEKRKRYANYVVNFIEDPQDERVVAMRRILDANT